jgi:quinol monooxygenase YgiN
MPPAGTTSASRAGQRRPWGDAMDRCYVTALITPKPDKRSTLKEAILANIPIVRKEKGCLRYDLHELQSDGSQFVFYEIWENRAALDVHSSSAHMTAYRARTKDWLAEPTKVSLWSAVDVAD